MREIKFRAWDKDANQFIDDIIIDMRGNEFQYNKCEFWGDDRHIVLMQYTGLKDRHGREIYEGDVVEYENGNAGYGRPRQEEISRDVIPDLTEHEDFYCEASWWVGGEIIGNIYENPELARESIP